MRLASAENKVETRKRRDNFRVMAAVSRITYLNSGDVMIDVEGDNYNDTFNAFVASANTFDARRVAIFSHAIRPTPSEVHYILAFLG